ncbi:MAG TPA: FtsQ-type POTRA domain-containing protein [Mycobacteriales bacterium]|nr:FtsQ-type POTRA domain-containing protein [Mycobacteriales bacterium]
MSPPTRVAPRPAAPPAPSSRRGRLLAAVAVAVVLLAAAVWVVGFSGVLGVRRVTVTGLKALSAEQVRAAAAVPDGRPLARVDTGAVADRVRSLAGVERVAVTRSWPGTLRITVTERHGVALVDRGSALWLVDPDGVVFQRLSTHPKLPILRIPGVRPDSDVARAALAAVTALPPTLLAHVEEVRAPTPEQVTLSLTGKRTVRWGGGADSAAKASVLVALLSRPGSYYDVSTPSVVTVR